eukprot:c2980_g1_i1.p1 GENE.c2980_g1_i1~~c2980_g1_i1.p1  ORF type:complete len:608 (+),score=149.99 c2980_g1_i1:676-2499(+)
MDWAPVSSALCVAPEMHSLTPAQESKLLSAFRMFDVDLDGKLSYEETVDMLKAIDVDMTHINATELFAASDLDNDGRLSVDEVRQAVTNHNFYSIQQGRYFVVLSLTEAEHLRGLLHMRAASQLFAQSQSRSTISLSTVSGLELGRTVAYEKPSPYQHSIGMECLRFFDSQVDYDEKQINMLLRSLQADGCVERREFFVDVRSCRRRRQVAWEQTPLAPLFLTPDQFHLLSTRAIVSRVTACLIQRGLFPLDAFRIFDTNHDGMISTYELYSGFVWLGVDLVGSRLTDLVCSMDQNGLGQISQDDFQRTFEASVREQFQRQQQDGSAVVALPPTRGSFAVLSKPVSLLDDGPAKSTEVERERASSDSSTPTTLQLIDTSSGPDTPRSMNSPRPIASMTGIIVQMVPQNSYDELWTSRGSMAHKEGSLWRMQTHVGLTKANSKRVCVGDYAVGGFVRPTRKSLLFRLQLEDKSVLGIQGSFRLNEVVRQRMPHPTMFRLVWSQERGERPVYAWQPIPPSAEFVALGMVVTNSSASPALDTVHCVPRSWVVPTKTTPILIWNDSGAGGREGSIWKINSMGLMAVVASHAPPKGPFFDPMRSEFSASEGL